MKVSNLKKSITRRLLAWFRTHGRTYPWRETKDPYRVLVAEMLLQRTKAAQVEKVYPTFLKRFPSTQTLSAASEEEITVVIRSLGLAWRALKFKEMASAVEERFAGIVPRSRADLLSLPGVGDYVADTVLSFAFGAPAAALDSNVVRVISRVFDVKPKSEGRRDRRIKEIVSELVPKTRSREFNLAIIDLGATVCTPADPKCKSCPLFSLCSFPTKQRSGTTTTP